MRPYLKTHSDAGTAIRYAFREGSEVLGGTLPFLGQRAAADTLDRLSGGAGLVHITLSLPQGLHADRETWLKAAATALQELGLKPQETPWLAVRHRDSACDHIHTICGCRSFADQTLTANISRRTCERVHRSLTLRMGLELPVYPDPAIPRLAPHTPKRRLKSSIARRVHEAVQTVFISRQPETWREFFDALASLPSPVTTAVTENRHGKAALKLTSAGESINSGSLGPPWYPKNISTRMVHCRKLRRTRKHLELLHIARVLAPHLRTLNGLTDDLSQPSENARTSWILGNHPPAVEADGWQRYLPAPAPGPAGDPGKGGGRHSGKADQLRGVAYGRTERSPGTARGGSGHAAGNFNADRGEWQKDAALDGGLGTPGGITWGQLITQALALLRGHFPDARWQKAHGRRALMVAFCDGSRLIVTSRQVEHEVYGGLGREFEEFYASAYLDEECDWEPEAPSPL